MPYLGCSPEASMTKQADSPLTAIVMPEPPAALVTSNIVQQPDRTKSTRPDQRRENPTRGRERTYAPSAKREKQNNRNEHITSSPEQRPPGWRQRGNMKPTPEYRVMVQRILRHNKQVTTSTILTQKMSCSPLISSATIITITMPRRQHCFSKGTHYNSREGPP